MSCALVWLTLLGTSTFGELADHHTHLQHALPPQLELTGPSSISENVSNDVALVDEHHKLGVLGCTQLATPGVPPATVGVRVLSPASVGVGETVSCRIRVYNRSPVAVYHVEVRDRISPAAEILATQPQAEQRQSLLVWHFDQLRPGEVREILLHLRATSGGPIRQCVRVRYEHGVCVETDVQPSLPPTGPPQLELHKEGPTQLMPGESAMVRLIVRNRGQAPAEDVVVVDELPAGLQHADGGQRLNFLLGRIPPGKQRNLEYRIVAQQPGQWTNRAHARSRDGQQAFATQTVTVAEPKLAVQIDAPAQVHLGATIPVQITVSNASAMTLRQVRVDYRLPSGVAVVESQPRASLGPAQVSWTISQLQPQDKVSLSLQLRYGQADTLQHSVTVTVGAQRFNAQAKTQVVGAAGLLLVVVDTEDPVVVGQDTRYHLIVRNQGSAAATNIRLRVEVPKEFAITRVQGPSDHKRDGQLLLFESLHLPPNTDRIYRIYVRALKPGIVRLRVEMTADQLPAGPVRAQESTTIVDAAQP